MLSNQKGVLTTARPDIAELGKKVVAFYKQIIDGYDPDVVLSLGLRPHTEKAAAAAPVP